MSQTIKELRAADRICSPTGMSRQSLGDVGTRLSQNYALMAETVVIQTDVMVLNGIGHLSQLSITETLFEKNSFTSGRPVMRLGF